VWGNKHIERWKTDFHWQRHRESSFTENWKVERGLVSFVRVNENLQHESIVVTWLPSTESSTNLGEGCDQALVGVLWCFSWFYSCFRASIVAIAQDSSRLGFL